MAAAIAKNGLGILVTFGKYVGEFYLGLAILWGLLLLVGYLFLKNRLPVLLKRISTPMSIAFSTASSEAVYPKLVEEMERFGCNNKIVSFVLPLGYSFNLDGTSIYLTMAAVFLAQATNTPMDIGQQISLLLILLLTSKGAAGVTGSGFITLAATLPAVGHIPVASIALILGIDRFMSEGRALTNIIGNAVATIYVAKWEKEIDLKTAKETIG